MEISKKLCSRSLWYFAFFVFMCPVLLMGTFVAIFVFGIDHWSMGIVSGLLVLATSLMTLSYWFDYKLLRKLLEAERTNGRKLACAVEVNKAFLETLIMNVEVQKECDGETVVLH